MASEKRLISVDEWDSFFAEHIYNRCFRNEYEQGYTDALDRVDDWMDCHPTVDAVEVVNGHWISKGYKIECSVCEHREFLGTHDPVIHAEEKNIRKYCHNCGAKMDGGNDV